MLEKRLRLLREHRRILRHRPFRQRLSLFLHPAVHERERAAQRGTGPERGWHARTDGPPADGAGQPGAVVHDGRERQLVRADGDQPRRDGRRAEQQHHQLPEHVAGDDSGRSGHDRVLVEHVVRNELRRTGLHGGRDDEQPDQRRRPRLGAEDRRDRQRKPRAALDVRQGRQPIPGLGLRLGGPGDLDAGGGGEPLVLQDQRMAGLRLPDDIAGRDPVGDGLRDGNPRVRELLVRQQRDRGCSPPPRARAGAGRVRRAGRRVVAQPDQRLRDERGDPAFGAHRGGDAGGRLHGVHHPGLHGRRCGKR